jgi:methyl-accepting chemotaxis protein
VKKKERNGTAGGKTLFSKMVLSVVVILILMVGGVLGCFTLIYTRSYERDIYASLDQLAEIIAGQVSAFTDTAYRIVEQLAVNSDVISLKTDLQTPLFQFTVRQNPYFDLVYAQGMDGMQTGRSSGALGNRKNRFWFIHMEKQHSPFISESYYSISTRTPCTSVFYPIQKDGAMIGIMGADIKLAALQKVVEDNSHGGSWAYILDGKGAVVAHPEKRYFTELYNFKTMTRTVMERDSAGNPRLDEKNNVITKKEPFTLDATYRAELDQMMNGTAGKALVENAGRKIYISYRPIKLDGTSESWYVVSAKDLKTAMRTRNTLIFALLAVSLGVAVLALFIIFFVARKITAPLKGLSIALEKVGEGDLTTVITVDSQDEIGAMARLFGRTIGELKTLIIAVKERSGALQKSGDTLASTMSGTAAAINQVAATIAAIKDKTVGQSASVTETGAVMEQVTANIGKLDKAVEIQVRGLTKSSAAIESMLASIAQVTEALEKNNESVTILGGATDVGSASVNAVAADIQEIAKESAGLLEINAVMENIASQTNLLSMNAAIEAAHAGDVGKGFAVVADEIRKLSERSAEQSKTISTVLKKIKESIDKIISGTANTLQKFAAIETGIKKVQEQSAQMHDAMEEQNASNQHVLDMLKKLNNVSQEVRRSSAQMLEGSHEVIAESTRLETSAAEITSGMNDMAADAARIDSAVNTVRDLTDETKENIEALVNAIAKFRITD